MTLGLKTLVIRLGIIVCIWAFENLSANEPPAPKPTFATSVNATAYRGESVDITLRAKVASPRTQYLIRSEPKNGHLGEIKTSQDGSAIVVYTHDGSMQTAQDSFTYAAKNLGSSISARSEVDIQIVNRPAKLEIPLTIDFGRVPVGTSATADCRITNTGGQIYSGTVSVQHPWRIAENQSQLNLEPGAIAKLPLIFEPDSPIEFSKDLIFGTQPPSRVKLTGKGTTLFSVVPQKLSLSAEKDLRRTGHLQISNQSEQAIELTFDIPSELQPIPPLQVPPNSTREIDIIASPKTKKEAHVRLLVKEARLSLPIEVTIDGVPALLHVEPSTDLNFGKFTSEETSTRTLSFSNTGGSATTVAILPPRWTLVDTEHFALQPGETKTITFHATSETHGVLRSPIIFSYGGKKRQIMALAEIWPPQVKQSGKFPAVSEPFDADKAKNKLTRAKIAGDALHIEDIISEGENIYLTWKDPSPQKRNYQIELQFITSQSSLLRLKLSAEDKSRSGKTSSDEVVKERIQNRQAIEKAKKNDKIVTQWLPMPEVLFTRQNDGLILATFPAPPVRQITVRITAISLDGKRSPFHSVIHIPLKDRQKNPQTSIFVYGGLVATIIGLVFFLMNKRFSIFR